MACLSICKHFTASAVFPPLTCLSLLQICLLSSKGFSLFSKHFLIHLNQSIKIKSHLAVLDRFYVFTGGWISSYTHPKSTLSFIFPPNAGNCSGGWSPSPRKAQTWPQQQGPLIPPGWWLCAQDSALLQWSQEMEFLSQARAPNLPLSSCITS